MAKPQSGAVIAGLGMTELGRVYGRTTMDFAAEAIKLALEDAGLSKGDMDGILFNSGGIAEKEGGGGVGLPRYLGLDELRLYANMWLGGATAGAMVQYAAMAIQADLCNVVACVFADNPLKPKGTSGSAYTFQERSWNAAQGRLAPSFDFAMAARRHMHEFGTTSQQLGAIAVATRQWACRNPRAQMREPITLEDHQRSRIIVEPFRLLDCCLVSNGGIAVIVTAAERARSLPKPPVYIMGMGQGHFGHRTSADAPELVRSPATLAKETAFHMAGVTVDDIDVLELYDSFTWTVLVQLEDYGFCAKGEGGPLVEDGRLGPGGSLPTNTGGGQLSGYYMWGMTPLSEAIIQLRGEGGERQVGGARIALVSGSGGDPGSYHSTLILGRDPA